MTETGGATTRLSARLERRARRRLMLGGFSVLVLTLSATVLVLSALMVQAPRS